MKRYLGISLVCFCSLLLVAHVAMAKSVTQNHQFSEPQIDIDIIGDVDGTNPAPQKVLQDTVWIVTWTHDLGENVCDDLVGWEKVDAYIANDGVQYWDIDGTFGGNGLIAGNAAALGYENDLCCDDVNGYDNDWYQAIRIEYSGSGDISFDYLVDSEGGFDFLQVEEDSACASFDRVDFASDPSSSAAAFRTLLYSDSGFVTNGAVVSLGLTDFGTTSCVYIAFFADGAFSPCDGLQPTATGKALVVDNIVINDGGGTRSDDFTSGSLTMTGASFVNIADSTPFGPTDPGRDGSWARTFDDVTDNDVCTRNETCSVIWTDDTTPSIANDASMSFAPGGYVVKNWLDDRIISPWASLATTPTATGTLIQFRRFPGNFFSTSRMVQNWSVRGKVDVDDGLGGTVECISGWGHSFQWNSLSFFGWLSLGWDMSSNFDPTAKEIQVRHRTSDWQVIVGAPPPANFIPGPGPYIDRTRIGRQVLSGPVINEGIDARQQGQDAYPTQISTAVTPGTGDHYEPTLDRFGTTAFSRGTELGINNSSPNLITGDSVSVNVQDVRGAGGITSIDLYGAIVAGPHAGLAPPPHSVGGSGFFVIAADSVRNTAGVVVANNFFVDIDDEYLVGGDVLHYLWLAVDGLGGVTSTPVGLSGVPTSVADAQAATNGMFEMSALPAINWDPDYIAAVGVSNKVDPNSDPSYLDESSQKNCILYVNRINSRRRSGDVNRTSFMYTLDRLGYRGSYDVYDHTGMGNTNNHLGGRATVEQAQGYNLIVYDAGNVGPGGTIMPSSLSGDLDAEKVDQIGWFVSWLAQASTSEAGWATLWVMGSNFLQEKPTAVLYTGNMGTTLNATDQGLNANPDALGQTSFTFDVGAGGNTVDFTTGARSEYSLNGGCPVIRNYDGQQSGGTGVNVYLYADPNSGTTGDAAVVMNTNAAANTNTISMSHPWFDIREDFGGAPGSLTSAEDLAKSVLDGVLPTACVESEDPTDTGEQPEISAPAKTVLYLNKPNPFNPMTTISFDLAQTGHVSLKIYDVAGRLVRTLIDEKMTAGRNLQRVWDGMDESGQRTSSGVYFYRLEAPNFSAVNKMVMMK